MYVNSWESGELVAEKPYFGEGVNNYRFPWVGGWWFTGGRVVVHVHPFLGDSDLHNEARA